MKSIVRIILLVLSLSCLNVAFAQTEKRFLKEAEDAERSGDQHHALEFYLKALEKNPQNATTNFKIGVLYLDMIYKHRALPYLEKAFSLDPKISHQIHRYLGMAYHYNHEWDKAIEQYELCRKTLKHDDPFLKRVDRRIYECQNGKEFMAAPVDAKIVNIGNNINTNFPEFAPVISADESVLIFTSRREGSTGGQLDEAGEYYEDIYISEKQSNGEWGPPKNIGTNINTEGHDASIAVSIDGKELFIYDGNSGSGKGDIKYCDLKKDDVWSKPIPVPGINSSDGEASACLSPDRNTIFFTSDRPGGYGELDIYKSIRKKNGEWSKPENLGPVINTTENEDGVFLDFDGKTLHFSSQGHKGMGGFDIFKSEYDSTNNTWSKPVNIGYPINTADNDIYFVLSGDGRHGYYASVREDGVGEKDIYMIIMPERKDYQELVKKMEKMLNKEIAEVEEPVKPVEIKKEPVFVKGAVYDVKTNQPIVATVQLLSETGKVLQEVTTGDDGLYSFDVTSDKERKLSVTAQKDQYGLVTKKVTTPPSGTERVELVRDLPLGKLEVGAKFVLRNIYYDFDRAVLRAESVNELNKLLKLLKDNPTMKIRIGSHTDNKGSNEYNISLSQRRAMAVVTWLTTHGIEKVRLEYKGYGEEQPLASNDDEEEGRELNRRTEFEVIGK